MQESETLPSLDVNRVDHIVTVLKSVTGPIPVVGPLVAEAIGALIPNQRIDRLARREKAALKILLPDENAEIGPVPTASVGHKAEPELDRLSNILRAFNDHFGAIFNDANKMVHQVIATEIPAKVAANTAYQNAMCNSDKQNARIEHDKALQNVLVNLLFAASEHIADHQAFYKQFNETPDFRRSLTDMIFTATYTPPAG